MPRLVALIELKGCVGLYIILAVDWFLQRNTFHKRIAVQADPLLFHGNDTLSRLFVTNV